MQQMWREALPQPSMIAMHALSMGAVESGFGHLSPEVVRGIEHAERKGAAWSLQMHKTCLATKV